MRVLLISGNREDSEIRVPALGLACVAASSMAAGHEVQTLDLLIATDPEKAVRETIDRFRPDAIGISVRNIDDQNMRHPRFLLDQARETVAWCRSASAAPTIIGGAGFSILPGPVLEYLDADMGIAGEGELLFSELLRRIQLGKTPEGLPGLVMKGKNFAARRTFAKDMDTLPLPHPSLMSGSLAGARDAPVPVQTRRGCPLCCSYCSTPTIEGKKLRWRSAETVVDWIARWAEQGFRSFYFVDNTFNLPPSYAHNLCREIIEAKLGISWRCILYPSALDPQLAQALAEAGCREVSLGFESGSVQMLRWMKKHFSPQDIRKTSDLLHRHGIRRMGFLLLGGPGETRETVEESLEFAEELDLEALKLSIGIRIYPQTELARIAREEGRITSDADLLQPRFYVIPALSEWIYEQVARRAKHHPEWIF